jgi:hypothetical protein
MTLHFRHRPSEISSCVHRRTQRLSGSLKPAPWADARHQPRPPGQ